MIRLRRAVREDARRLYEWRNDPETRKWFFGNQPIPWESHLEWLDGILAREDARLWIASTDAEGDIGEVRLEPTPTPGEAKIHVLVDPSFRGRGLGANLIEVGTERYFLETSAQLVRAEVLAANSASGKAFQRAGYHIEGARNPGGDRRWVRSRGTYVFFGGVEASRAALAAACEMGLPPLGAFQYDDSLRARAGYVDLDDLSAHYGFPLHRTRDANAPEILDRIEALSADILLVVGWSQILSPSLLARARRGAFGIHPTRLPEGRGRAPIPWTILRGLQETSVTLFRLEERADRGPIVDRIDLRVEPWDDAARLYRKVGTAHADLIRRNLRSILAGMAATNPQDESRASKWPRRRPEDGVIAWDQPARKVYDWIRGLSAPYPGAFTLWNGQTIRVGSAVWISDEGGASAPPGTVLGSAYDPARANPVGIRVAAADGSVVCFDLAHFPNGEPLPTDGMPDAGTCLGVRA